MGPKSDCPGSAVPKNRRRSRLLPLLAGLALLGALVLGVTLAFASAPVVSVGPASQVGYTTAQVEGTVDAEGEPTTYHFQVVTQAEFEAGGWAEVASNPQVEDTIEGSTAEAVEGTLSGLHPEATYHLRLLAENGGGPAEAVAATTFTTEAVVAPGVSIEPVTTFSGTTAHLVGHIDPEAPQPAGSETPAEEAAFEVHWHFECTPECPGLATEVLAADSSSHEVVSEATGLDPGTAYEVSLVGENAGGEETRETAGPVSFTTPAIAPTITGTTSTAIGGTEATLVARVDPGGAETTYHFEYGTDEGYGHATPTGTIATELNSADTVEAHLAGLEPGASYHFRLVASNSAEPAGVDGQDTTFTAVEAFGPGLPDGRVYERVSPVEDESADVSMPPVVSSGRGYFLGISRTSLPFQAADDGNAVAYVGDATVGGNGKSGSGDGNQYLAIHRVGGGWSQTTITPSENETGFYEAFSPDLSLGIVQSGDPEVLDLAPLSSDGPAPGWKALYSHRFDEASYSALFTASATPQNRGKEEFGTPGVPTYLSQTANPPVDFAGASADQRRLLFEANAALTPSAPDGSAEENNLYLSEDGILRLVNVLPEGTTQAGATFGAAAAGATEGNDPDYSHVISADGERVYWTDVNGEGSDDGHIYLREHPTAEQSIVGCEAGKACTIPVSGGEARYWTATPDGRYAYYTEAEELWRFDAASGEREAIAGPGVQAVIGTNEAKEESEDGGYVYFTSRSDLSGPERDSQGRPAQEGEENVFVLHGTAAPRLVATLSSRDGEEALGEALNKRPNRQIGDVQPGLGNRTAEVSADGTGLVFMSDDQSVEGFTPIYQGTSLEEVYSYSYAGDHLSCASCGPAHQQTPPQPSSVISGELENEGVGAILPPGYSHTYLPHWLSSDGSRVFFDSFEPLLPADTDDLPDVYEWERDGTGSCTRRVGCLFLISSGTSNSGGGWLIDASASGNDVFFLSRSELVSGSESENGASALYDARVGGVTPPPSAPCDGAGCQAEPTPGRPFSTPGGSTFHGPEEGPRNVSRRSSCPKGKVRKHGKCVKQKAKTHRKSHKGHRRHHKNHGRKQRAGSESGGRK